MSIHFGFYDSINGDRKYNAQEMSQLFDGIIRDGVLAYVGDKLAVSPGDGMSVLVGSGRAWFNQTWTYNDTYYNLPIQVSDPAFTRIDAVIIDVDKRIQSRLNQLMVLTGSPSTSPQKPSLVKETNHYQYALAYVTVNAGVGKIELKDIQNVVGNDQETPFVTGPLETVSAQTLYTHWEGEFKAWFDNVKAQLEGSIVTNLQKEIDERLKIEDKATSADITAGTSDTKYVTPKALKETGILGSVGSIMYFAKNAPAGFKNMVPLNSAQVNPEKVSGLYPFDTTIGLNQFSSPVETYGELYINTWTGDDYMQTASIFIDNKLLTIHQTSHIMFLNNVNVNGAFSWSSFIIDVKNRKIYALNSASQCYEVTVSKNAISIVLISGATYTNGILKNPNAGSKGYRQIAIVTDNYIYLEYLDHYVRVSKDFRTWENANFPFTVKTNNNVYLHMALDTDKKHIYTLSGTFIKNNDRALIRHDVDTNSYVTIGIFGNFYSATVNHYLVALDNTLYVFINRTADSSQKFRVAKMNLLTLRTAANSTASMESLVTYVDMGSGITSMFQDPPIYIDTVKKNIMYEEFMFNYSTNAVERYSPWFGSYFNNGSNVFASTPDPAYANGSGTIVTLKFVYNRKAIFGMWDSHWSLVPHLQTFVYTKPGDKYGLYGIDIKIYQQVGGTGGSNDVQIHSVTDQPNYAQRNYLVIMDLDNHNKVVGYTDAQFSRLTAAIDRPNSLGERLGDSNYIYPDLRSPNTIYIAAKENYNRLLGKFDLSKCTLFPVGYMQQGLGYLITN